MTNKAMRAVIDRQGVEYARREIEEKARKRGDVLMAEHKTLALALAAAQAELPAVKPDSVNPHFKSKFVSLGHLLAKVRPVLNRHGITVIQLPARDADGAPTLRTTLLHTSGEVIEANAPLMLAKNDAQAQGSAITYMRRYALAAALGISDQEDDDGNHATEAKANEPKAVSKAKVKALATTVKDKEIDHETLCFAFAKAGADAPTADTADARATAFFALTAEQADKLEAVFAGE